MRSFLVGFYRWDLPADRGRLWRLGARAGAMFVAAGVLLWVARSSFPTILLATAAVVYVAVTTLWVRGTYVASLTEDDGPWTPPVQASALAAVVFGVVLWLGWTHDVGTLVIIGMVGAFFSLGYVAMGIRVRSSHDTDGSSRAGWEPATWAWSVVLVLVALVALAGLLGAPQQVGWVLPVVIAPIPVSVLTSRACRSLGSSRRRTLGAMTAVGLALFLGGSAVAYARVDNPAMLLAAAAIGLLVVALASSTYADIAVVIGVIAALGVTPQQNSHDEARLLGTGEDVLVAFGDSYMSGEGARVFHEATTQAGRQCRRAPTAFAEMAGQLDRFGGFVSFACSGARTYNVRRDPDPGDGLFPQRQHEDIETQLDAWAAMRDDVVPSLVLVGLGGNDAGFSTIGAMCLAPGDCGGGDGGDGDANHLLVPNLKVVRAQLDATFAEIKEEFSAEGPEGAAVPVAVVGYPDPVFSADEVEDDPDGSRASGGVQPDCSRVPLSARDRDFVETFLRGEDGSGGLNSVVRQAAATAGFHYVAEMESALADAHLQLCDPRNNNRPGLNIVSLRSVPGEANERFNPKNWYHNSLHPNEAGHAAMLVAFERWLATWTGTAAPGLPDGAAPGAGEPSAMETTDSYECQIHDPDKIPDDERDTYGADDSYFDLPTCEDAGYRWVGQQVSGSLLGWWGLLYLVIALGAWLVAVALFAAHHRWRSRPVGAVAPAPPP